MDSQNIFLALGVMHLIGLSGGANQLVVQVHYPSQNLPRNAAITLRGDGLGLSWSQGVPMEAAGSNVWTLSLPFQPSDVGSTLHLKSMVNDDTWQIGANVAVVVPSSSATADVYPFFYTGAGIYTYIRNVYSPQLKNTRDLVIYTPPSYLENTLKIIQHTLVMHDGQNLFNASTSFAGVAWQCDKHVDQLVVEGLMDEIVIVGVDNTPDRTDELTYSYDPSVQAGGKGDLYLDFIEQTVLPIVQKQYRVRLDQPSLGILGSSLGGLISCYAGWTRNGTYGRAGCMSSSFWWNNEDFNNGIMVNDTTPAGLTIYVDSGDSGPDNDDEAQTQRVRDHMVADGFELGSTLFYYLDHGGVHNEASWGNRFWSPMQALYPPSITPTH